MDETQIKEEAARVIEMLEIQGELFEAEHDEGKHVAFSRLVDTANEMTEGMNPEVRSVVADWLREQSGMSEEDVILLKALQMTFDQVVQTTTDPHDIIGVSERVLDAWSTYVRVLMEEEDGPKSYLGDMDMDQALALGVILGVCVGSTFERARMALITKIKEQS